MKNRVAVAMNIVSSMFEGKTVPNDAAKSKRSKRSTTKITEKPITLILFKVLPNLGVLSKLKRCLFVMVSQTHWISKYQNIAS